MRPLGRASIIARGRLRARVEPHPENDWRTGRRPAQAPASDRRSSGGATIEGAWNMSMRHPERLPWGRHRALVEGRAARAQTLQVLQAGLADAAVASGNRRPGGAVSDPVAGQAARGAPWGVAAAVDAACLLHPGRFGLRHPLEPSTWSGVPVGFRPTRPLVPRQAGADRRSDAGRRARGAAGPIQARRRLPPPGRAERQGYGGRRAARMLGDFAGG